MYVTLKLWPIIISNDTSGASDLLTNVDKASFQDTNDAWHDELELNPESISSKVVHKTFGKHERKIL